jgi:beta-aspartyl-peptidase (threonine type)
MILPAHRALRAPVLASPLASPLVATIRGVIACVLLGWLFLALPACATHANSDTATLTTDRPLRWAIAIHGGAGTIEPTDDPQLARAYRESLRRALDAGADILAASGSALDACEAAVRILEDDELFNAGRGAALNREGIAELDAAIMDGSTLRAGAVTGVTTVRNPVSLARRVMSDTRHILLAGPGAERFADATGLERVDNSWFVTPRRRKMLDDALAAEPRAATAHTTPAARFGTVGAVARDSSGRLAAATSTGGLTAKLPGRVGDAPLIGAGTYANARVAISCTGTGEQFIRHGVARGIASRAELLNEPIDAAASHFIHSVLNPDDGGLIAVDASGRVATPFSTIGMYRGIADSNGRRDVAIWKD